MSLQSLVAKYDAAKKAEGDALDLVGRVGAWYSGGGGGIGEVREMRVKLVVYYQAYDGAKNYHESDSAFSDALSAEVLDRREGIIAGALGRMKLKRVSAAEALKRALNSAAEDVA